MVEERLSRPDAAEGFILDGFPRTVPQATALAETMRHLHRSLSAVVYIRVPDDAIIERLSGRFVCSTCQAPYHRAYHPPRVAGVCDKCGGKLYQRDDVKPDTVRARLRTFHKQTEPLIERYQREGLLITVDGLGAIQIINQRVSAAVHGLRAQPSEWEIEQGAFDAALA
jgi:adenylate kinase